MEQNLDNNYAEDDGSEAVVWRCSMKEGALKDFAKLKPNHLCWSLFCN